MIVVIKYLKSFHVRRGNEWGQKQILGKASFIYFVIFYSHGWTDKHDKKYLAVFYVWHKWRPAKQYGFLK